MVGISNYFSYPMEGNRALISPSKIIVSNTIKRELLTAVIQVLETVPEP